MSTKGEMVLGKIYVIRAELPDGSLSEKMYIGSTSKRLTTRLNEHIKAYKRYKEGKVRWLSSFKILEMGKPVIELLESIVCTQRELLLKEGEHQKQRKDEICNKKIEGSGPSEWTDHKDRCKSHYMMNKDRYKEYYQRNKERVAQYYQDNREKALAYQRAYRQNKRAKREQERTQAVDIQPKTKKVVVIRKRETEKN